MTQETQQKPKRNKQQTKTYKHVTLERKRPELSKDGKPGKKPAQRAPKHSSIETVKKDPRAQLRVIPLGGLDGIGKNMCAFECNGDILVDDAGLMFPDDDHPGIDLILPDYTYLLENVDRIKAIVITHGHEDHIGALPYLLKDLDRDIVIYGTKLTLGLIAIKFNEFHISNAKLTEIKPGKQIKAGCFRVNFFSVNHSIPDAVGVFIQSPAGNVLHTGDFKLDQTPIDGVLTDFESLFQFGKIGVDLLMSDSTNAQRPGFTLSESVVGSTLSQLISQATGKVIIASFASHIHRLQQVCDAATQNGRKVVVTGRSMIQNTDIARKLGYLHVNDEDILDAYYIDRIPPEQVVVMCTGSQGEPLSALARMASGGHRTITIDEGDTVIISATPVPGNEKAVTRVINALSKIGAKVYDKNSALVHVSGHASQEELKLLLTVVRPKAFMPVHGEALHLRAHASLAREMGVPEDRVFICENGDTLVLQNGSIEMGEPVESGLIYVDGLSVGDTSQDVLDERLALSSQGVAVVAAAVDMRKRMLIGELKIQMRGITGGDDFYLHEEMTRVVAGSINRALSKGSDQIALQKIARDALLSLLWERIKQRPTVIANIIEV